MFRDLRADEIECRVAQAKENGVSLLLYKDARCDQNILDETVGPMNWQRHHVRDNANCIVSIWDNERNMWVSKEDTGTESNTEKEKGLASDSFKRACFNWGIGRELYTAPFIWINARDCTALKPKQRGDGWQCFDTFVVTRLKTNNKRIVFIAIKNAKTGATVFEWEAEAAQPITPAVPKKEETMDCMNCGKSIRSYIGKNGKRVSVERHCTASFEKYNRVLCLDCIGKLNGESDA